MRTLCLALALLCLPSIGFADEILTYTGQDYTNVNNPPEIALGPFFDLAFTTGMNITMTIDLAAPLPDSSDIVVNPVTFTLNDGPSAGDYPFLPVSQWCCYVPYTNFEFQTDASGNIIGWYISYNPSSDVAPFSNLVSCNGIAACASGNETAYDSVSSFQLTEFADASNENSPGTWSIVDNDVVNPEIADAGLLNPETVISPEPDTLTLSVIGLGLLLAAALPLRTIQSRLRL